MDPKSILKVRTQKESIINKCKQKCDNSKCPGDEVVTHVSQNIACQNYVHHLCARNNGSPDGKYYCTQSCNTNVEEFKSNESREFSDNNIRNNEETFIFIDKTEDIECSAILETNSFINTNLSNIQLRIKVMV